MIKNEKEITQHYIKFFGSEPDFVYSPMDEFFGKIILLLFSPCEKTNYWKICSIGASNAHPIKEKNVNPYNEYVIFIAPDEDLKNDEELRDWYSDILMSVAMFPFKRKEALFYGHDLKFNNATDDMVASIILFPEVIEDIGFVSKRIKFKDIWFLQVMPITEFEHSILTENGFKICEKLFYPENKDNTRPFAQRTRSFD